VQHFRRKVGKHDSSVRRQWRDAQTWLTRSRRNVEMPMIFGYVEKLDDRCPDGAS